MFPLFVLILAGVFAGTSALLLILWFAPERQPPGLGAVPKAPASIRKFRFRDNRLVDHSGNITFLLPAPVNPDTAWCDLVDMLSDMDPRICDNFRALEAGGTPFESSGLFGSDRITVFGHRDGPDLVINVTTTDAADTEIQMSRPNLIAMKQELSLMSRASSGNPALSWACDGDHRIIWANSTYLDLLARCLGADEAKGWPIQRLFPDAADPRPGRSRRKCHDQTGAELWFDVTVLPPDADGQTFCHALPLDHAIRAEANLRAQIASLTDTLSTLPVGTAMFARDGQLTFFNDALIDLTGLDDAWLSRKPHLTDLLDALRERKKLPEPRDYKSWRNALTGSDEAPLTVPQTVNWTLSTGLAFKLTTRPQADGGITLTLEQAVTDVTGARLNQQTIAQIRDLLEACGEGLIAFDAKGVRGMTNRLGFDLWPDGDFIEEMPDTLDACIAVWKPLYEKTSAWADIRAVMQTPPQERAAWAEDISGLDGRQIRIRIVPQADGGLILAARDVTGLPKDAVDDMRRADRTPKTA